MALNFSHRPIFPGGLSEDNLVSSMRMGNGYTTEGIPEKSGGGDGYSTGGWRDVENHFDYGGRDMCVTQDSVPEDILELLPPDPFNMGMDKTTILDMDKPTINAVFTGWLEDLEVGGYHGTTGENYPLIAHLLSNAVRLHAFPLGRNVCIEGMKVQGVREFGECSRRDVGHTSCGFGSVSAGSMHAMSGFVCDNNDVPVASVSGCDANTDDVNFPGGDERELGGCSQREVRGTSCGFGSVSAGNVNAMSGYVYNDVPIASVSGGDMNMDDVNFPGGDEWELGECSQRDVGGTSCGLGSVSAGDMDALSGFVYSDVPTASVSGGHTDMDDVNCLGGDDLSPHPGLGFSLSYLGLSDLLAVESVCKSLHSTVRGDPLLWRSIHIHQPLNERITDDLLFKLTNRAQGNLQSLSLVDCSKITDDGLKRVLEVNRKLIKLSVPGCTRLSIEGVVSMLKAYNSITGTQGLKHLHIGGLYGVTQKHFEELKLLLGTDSQVMKHSHQPHFYRRGSFYLPFDDDRALDIEVCPRCQNLRLVYDCPAEGCQGVGHTTQACRGCTLCVPRCSQCGHCIFDSEYEETFCLELLCSSCSKQLINCSERVE